MLEQTPIVNVDAAELKYFESHGYKLVGFMPGYDREEISAGIVKRVVEAAYVKCLVGSEAMLSPDVSNMTSTVRRLYEVMYEIPLAPVRPDPIL